MKVSDTAGTRAAAPRRVDRAKARRAGADAFRLPSVGDEAEVPKAAGPAAAAPVDSLLALQEVPDATDGRSRGLRHGADILDLLDQIQRDLLLGRMPPERLRRLTQMLQYRRANIMDPQLSALLGEIELRAAVELAKFQVAD